MKCIVPYGGPDFYIKKEGVPKPLLSINGKLLVELTIFNRPWYGKVINDEDITFVLCNLNYGNDQFVKFLENKHPKCNVTYIENYTNGAYTTSLSGIKKDNELIIDLADITFNLDVKYIENWLRSNSSGLVPFFKTKKNGYSYIDKEGSIVKNIREKDKISDYATAGVYFFRSSNTYTKLSSRFLKAKEYHYNGLLYVAPVYNFLENVEALEIEDEIDYSLACKEME